MFPRAKSAITKLLFYLINSPKPKDIQFTLMTTRTVWFRKLKPSNVAILKIIHTFCLVTKQRCGSILYIVTQETIPGSGSVKITWFLSENHYKRQRHSCIGTNPQLLTKSTACKLVKSLCASDWRASNRMATSSDPASHKTKICQRPLC